VSTVRVEKTIAAPIERVFELISDHAGYSRFPGIQHSELLREGDEERNGVGAVRRVHSRPLRFEEEVTRFERPSRMDYLIREVNAPIRHLGGSMVLEERGSGTHVVWTSSFEYTLRRGGGLLDAVAVPVVSRGFRRVLDEVERLAAVPTAPMAASNVPA
jgi:uncharacterized protein YndB with AHSA1/START domain